jgi:hypothetical protein
MKKYFLFSFLLFLLSAPFFAFAQTIISPSIPGMTTAATTSTSPGVFVNGFYLFALMIGGVLAFGAVVYGGILYAISAGNSGKQSEGKEWIKSAIYGLLLLAGAYLVLYTINPNLVSLSLPTLSAINIQAPSTGGGGSAGTGQPGQGNVPGSGLNTAQVTANFQTAGITVKPGAGLDGMLQQTVSDIDNLEASCKQAEGSCNMLITEGTGAHAAGTGHSLGYKADIGAGDSNLNAFITSLPQAGGRTENGVWVQYYAYGGGTIADERNVPGVGPHWDLSSGGGHY